MINERLLNQEIEALNKSVNDTFANISEYNIKEKIEEKGLVDTGELKESINIENYAIGVLRNEHLIYMEEYGEYLELGTPYLPPQRFVREGLIKSAKQLESKVG